MAAGPEDSLKEGWRIPEETGERSNTAAVGTKARMTRRSVASWIGLALLFTALAAASPGMRDVNSGSHYALVRALAHGTPRIDRYFDYVEDTDYAQRGGHYYSDKPPGTAALALPFYELGRLVAGGDAEHRHHFVVDSESPNRKAVPPVEEYTTNLLSALAGVAVLLLAFAVCMEFGAHRRWAWFTAIAVFAGTMLWRYATTFFSHEVASALLLAMVLLGLRSLRRAAAGDLVLLGLVGAVGVTVDYSLLVPFVGIAGVALWKRRNLRDVGALAAGAVAPLTLLAGYHLWAFGSPFRTSYAFKARVEFAFTRSFGGLYSGGFANFFRLLADPSAGLVVWNPLLLVAPFGAMALARRDAGKARLVLLALVLLAIVVVPLLLLQAKFLTWEGGRTNDARYSTVLIGPALMAVSVWLDGDWRVRWHRWVAVAAVGALAALGFALQMARLVASVGHSERLAGGPPIRVDATYDLVEAGRQICTTAFPSIRYAPVTLMASLALTLGVASLAGRHRPPGPAPTSA